MGQPGKIEQFIGAGSGYIQILLHFENYPFSSSTLSTFPLNFMPKKEGKSFQLINLLDLFYASN
jgi:hypothetical protein